MKEARTGGVREDGAPSRDELIAAIGLARVAELEGSLEEELACPICMDVQDMPVATSCGHGRASQSLTLTTTFSAQLKLPLSCI